MGVGVADALLAESGSHCRIVSSLKSIPRQSIRQRFETFSTL
jgi:hypothetical protein